MCKLCALCNVRKVGGTMPGTMPGMMRGMVPGVMPGMVPGLMPGVMPGLKAEPNAGPQAGSWRLQAVEVVGILPSCRCYGNFERFLLRRSGLRKLRAYCVKCRP